MSHDTLLDCLSGETLIFYILIYQEFTACFNIVLLFGMDNACIYLQDKQKQHRRPNEKQKDSHINNKP